MADFGFGTYRISDQNQAHLDALSEALRNGIKLIDTATNYYDGGAERAIGKVLSKYGDRAQNNIEIVSKFGYIQGSLLEEYKNDQNLQKIAQDIVQFSPNVYHCISKEFVHHQLDRSLERLGQEKLSCYLIHNPEYFILDAIKKNIPKEEYLSEMNDRIFDAFCALEEEVQKGRIGSYGISSNSFAKPHDADDFLPYEGLLDIAYEASQKVGNQTHSFTTIELPINIAEKEGLFCSYWAKENGLRVLANRPLNALYNGQMYRLAEYDEHRDYYMYLNELLEFCDNELLEPVYNIIEQLDESLYRFSFVGEYDTFLHTQVLPHLQRSLKDIDGDTQEKVVEYLDFFLSAYRQMVAAQSSKKTKEALAPLFRTCNDTMQECALKYLLKQESIDYVIVGARKVSYVYQLLALRESLN
jgi:aryl-alcohol dehydrogenase-like predicted oxidoreductase